LLDKADWNDTLRLDPAVMKGPQKEEAYLRQLKEKNQKYGVPFENTLCESVMFKSVVSVILLFGANAVSKRLRGESII
jgi:ABC-type polysaccharide transport system, permease component